MREVSQVGAIVNQALNSAVFALEGEIVSVQGGKATVQPTAKRTFGDNDDAHPYPPVRNVRLLSLVWDGGASGVSGAVKAGDPCVLIAISHGDGDEPDHKTLSACVAICGMSDASAFPMPDAAGVRVFSDSASVTLNDNNVTASSGGGAEIVLSGGAITMTAPDGLTINANTQINGNVGMAGSFTATAGADGGGNASFSGDVRITGTSTAGDHVSGGKSGRAHKHKENGDGGGITDGPM